MNCPFRLCLFIFFTVGSTLRPASPSWFFRPAGSGSIDPDELRTVLKSCLRESAISLPEEKLDDLTLALFESADKDNSGAITFEELKAELENFPEVMENLTIRSGPTRLLITRFLHFLMKTDSVIMEVRVITKIIQNIFTNYLSKIYFKKNLIHFDCRLFITWMNLTKNNE